MQENLVRLTKSLTELARSGSKKTTRNIRSTTT